MFTSGFKKDITIFSIFFFILKIKFIHVYKTRTVGNGHWRRKQIQFQLCAKYGDGIEIKNF